LVKLKDIRSALVAEKSGETNKQSSSEMAGELAQLRSERDKLAYRVQHLVKALNRSEEANRKE
jgi:hypothetical protein